MPCFAEIYVAYMVANRRSCSQQWPISYKFAHFLKGHCSFWPICRNLHRTSHSSWTTWNWKL